MTSTHFLRLVHTAWPALVLLTACSAETTAGRLAQALASPLEVQDLAILLPMDERDPIKASETLAGAPLLGRDWLRTVEAAFERTPVENALAVENIYEDWQVVSLRISPCAALGVAPFQDVDALCWPEVRLVLQPIVPNLRLTWKRFDHYADDRAIHAIYPWAAPGRERAIRIGQRLAQGLPIDAADRQAHARDLAAAVDDLVAEVLALRAPGLPATALGDLDLRAETVRDPASAQRFLGRLRAFLSRRAARPMLRKMTAFSLPEGRVPALQDAWIFVAFTGDGSGALAQQDLEVFSARTGQVLATMPQFQHVDTGFEDPVLQQAAVGDVGDALREQVIFEFANRAGLVEKITDPAQTLVPNTTCASCHRLNRIAFDFHNLSHLEERPHTISPRVAADVASELAWLAAGVRAL